MSSWHAAAALPKSEANGENESTRMTMFAHCTWTFTLYLAMFSALTLPSNYRWSSWDRFVYCKIKSQYGGRTCRFDVCLNARRVITDGRTEIGMSTVKLKSFLHTGNLAASMPTPFLDHSRCFLCEIKLLNKPTSLCFHAGSPLYTVIKCRSPSYADTIKYHQVGGLTDRRMCWQTDRRTSGRLDRLLQTIIVQ